MVSLFRAFCCLSHYWVALGRLCSSITPSWQIDQVKSEDWDEWPPCFMPKVRHDPASEPFHPHIVDRIVDPSALPEDTASAAHNSYKRRVLVDPRTCYDISVLRLLHKWRASRIPLCKACIGIPCWLVFKSPDMFQHSPRRLSFHISLSSQSSLSFSETGIF